MLSLVGFFYTDMLDVTADELEAVARVCRAFEGEGLREMADRLDARRWLYRSGDPTTKSGPQRRFVLQAQRAEHRLPADLRRILQDCLANSREEDLHKNNPVSEYDDLADMRIKVGDRVFRCHQLILALRSEYFKTNLSPRSDFVERREEHDDVSADAFEKMLEYAYTDELPHLGDDDPLALAEELLDVAKRYRVFPLKPIIVAALPLAHLDLDHVSPAQLCRWLTRSYIFGVANVREHCLDVIAGNFEAFAETPEFRALLLSWRRVFLIFWERDGCPDTTRFPADAGDYGPLHGLRERCLGAAAAGLDGKEEESAALFDQRLEMLALAAQEEANNGDQGAVSSAPGRSPLRWIAAGLMKIMFCCIMPPEQEFKDKSNV
jgi:ankyrin repeat/BTB/POZ domain-containing protein 1